MKKILYTIVSVVILSAISWLLAEYFLFFRKPVSPDVAEIAITNSDNTVPIGREILYHTDFSLPWFGKIEDITANTGKHAVLAGSPEVKTIKIGVFSAVKRISFPLTAITPGKTADASLSFSTVIGAMRFQHKVTIPEFVVAEPTVQQINNLQLAGKEEIVPEKHILRNTVIICAVLLAAAILLTILYFTCLKKRKTALSEWEKTRKELFRLKSDVADCRITAENGFIRLTDLVRMYLEKRFGLPATRRTTSEFIEDISRNGDFVPENSKPFLRNFLEAADRVKFAMAYPEKELLNQALVNAESLIDATRPAEESKKEV